MKYKLIKEYPGSPKLGTILTHEELQYCNWNEYYQEVVEKDYEILSYIHNGSKHIWKKDPKFETYFYINQGLNPCTRLEDILKYPKIYLIHSVKRKDGEIFTIGDKVFSEYVNYTINKICIVNDKCMVSALYDINNPNGSRLHYNLNNLKKHKQPLFTTEDGVDIFEGDKYFICTASLSNCINNEGIVSKFFKPNPNYKYFSTKEKAEEYILMNKPCLSLKEIYDLTDKNSGLYNESDLEKLVKQKLKSC